METQIDAINRRRTERAHRLRKDGVQYKLRVIKDSGGQLELVEQPPKDQHWFAEWARLMQFSGWSP